jgi:GT2 family glycosyltransferase
MSSQGTTDYEPIDGSAKTVIPTQRFDSFSLDSFQSVDNTKKHAIDIIIPVYKGYQVTLDCLTSVLHSDAAAGANIIVIDDASPDRNLSDALQYLAGKGLLALIRNETNLGFVRSVNLGMSQSKNDVILLNSDTLVYGDWVARMARQANSDAKIATVTPFSDNATLCSYPLIYDDNDFALEMSHAELDAIMARVNAGKAMEIPTAVGFCMFIKRACLDDVGMFDAEEFGMGYGEENDFCLRAVDRGWKNVLAGDVFVTHVGSVSFGSSRTELQRVNGEKLARRYPDFLMKVAHWSSQDPLSALRQTIDVARLRNACPNPVLFLCHDLGGGTERHIQDLAAGLRAQGQFVIFMRPIKKHRTKLFIEASEAFVPNLNPFDFVESEHHLVDVIRELEVKHIHVHSLFDIDQRIVERLPGIAKAVGIKYDVTLHEYLSICPRTFLIDESGVYCGEPDVSVCQLCVEKNGSHFGQPSVQAWRESYARLLGGARRVFVPNVDVAVRIKKHYSSLSPVVRPHMEHIESDCQRPMASVTRQPGETLKVALIGVLANHKGGRVVEALCSDAMERRLPIEYVLFGERERPCNWSSARLNELGPYDEDEIFALLEANPCHLALFPAVWPETYSYTFSIALKSRLYPIAFDIGAIAERIKKLNWGTLLPRMLMEDAAFINDFLLTFKPEPAPSGILDLLQENKYDNYLRDYYELESLS